VARAGFAVLLVVAGVGLLIYMKNVDSPASGHSPATTVDIAAVTTDLLAMANAERRYFATNGKYASLGELRTGGDIPIPARTHYTYSAETDGAGFKIIATYDGPDPKAPKHLSVDETMSVKSY
jgi:hypothetical protein